MKNSKYFFLTLLAMAITAFGCKKVGDCRPGDKRYDEPNPSGVQKSAKGDPCEFERIAAAEADSLLNKVYGPQLRLAVKPAVSDPHDIEKDYWEAFNNNFVPGGALLDSATTHKFVIESWWKIADPFYMNDENLRKLHNKAVIYLEGAEDLKNKQGDLDDCEKVSVPEIKQTLVCDDEGNWRDFITGKIYKSK